MGAIGLFDNPLLIFIALFVYFAASWRRTRRRCARCHKASGHLRHDDPLRDAAPDTHIDEAVETLLSTSQSDFPVTDDGRLVGLLGRNDIVRALKQMGPDDGSVRQ